MRDIIEMARAAGIEFTHDPTASPPKAFVECWVEELERFAELVRADEREACLQIADQCADADMDASMAANAIRARGDK